MAARSPRMTDLTPAEWVVMKAVWEGALEEPGITTSEVLPAVQQEMQWHFSTLKTTMDRLVKKGYLESRIRGKTCFYKPAIAQEEVVRKSIGDFLDTMLEGTFGPLVAYLAERKGLSQKQIQDLEKILEEDRKKGER